MNKIKYLPLFVFVFAFYACKKTKVYEYDYLYNSLPFEMPKVQRPVFPDRQAFITDFGATGNGVELNTDVFNTAMKTLSEQGGGTLVVPPGIWLTGPIIFRSNINLHLEKGALILFSEDKALYPLIETSFEGLDTRRCQSPVSGKDLENIAITGEGAINGSGEVWRPLKREKTTEKHWKRVLASGGVLKHDAYWFPSESALKGELYLQKDLNVPTEELTEEEWLEMKDFFRPVMISFIRCKNLLLEGVLFENSPAWNIHPLMCENVIIDGIEVRNPSYSQNGDGIDIESCKNIIIVNTTLDVGDDAICLKSGKDKVGRERAMPTENLIVDNCKVFKGHGGFVVGSETSGGVRNVMVRNCQFIGTDVGLRFKSKRGRGGIVENIYIENINMMNITTDAFLFDLFYAGKSASEMLTTSLGVLLDKYIPEVTEETPVFRNIYAKNLVSLNSRRAMYFNGLPEMNISNVCIENAFFTANLGAELSEAENVRLKNVTVIQKEGEALILNNVKNVDAGNFNESLK